MIVQCIVTSLPSEIILPQEHNLNKLGRGPLVDASYQIPRLLALLFQTRILFSFFHIYASVNCVKCDPQGGSFSAQGA